VKEEAETVKEEAEEVKKENEELKEQVDAQEAANEENLKKEAENYVNLKSSEGYIKPAHKDRYISEYIRYKKEDEKLFTDFCEDIENRDIAISEAKKFNLSVEKYEMRKKQWESGNYKISFNEYLESCRIPE